MARRQARRPAHRGALSGVLGMLMVAGVLGAGTYGAGAADTAALTGTVLNGTTGDTPSPGIDLTLHVYQGDAEVSTKSATSGADGKYAIDGLIAGTDRAYVLSAKYRKVTYQTASVSLTPGETKTLDLKIYEGGDSAAKLGITNWLVWVDREGSGVAVQHDVTVENSGTKSFTGDKDLGEGQKAVLRLPLPPGATNFQYMGLFMQCCAKVDGDIFIHTAAVPPGLSSGTVRVSAPELTRLDLTAQLPTDTLRVFLPTDADVTAPATFKADGTVEDLGVTYQVFTTQNVGRGEMRSLVVKGLAEGGSGSLLWIVPVALVVVVGAGAFVTVRRRRHSGSGRRPAVRKGSGAASRPSQKAATAAPSAGAAREREMIVEEVAALDIAFERGALPADTYRRLREEKIAELLKRPDVAAEKGTE